MVLASRLRVGRHDRRLAIDRELDADGAGRGRKRRDDVSGPVLGRGHQDRQPKCFEIAAQCSLACVRVEARERQARLAKAPPAERLVEQ